MSKLDNLYDNFFCKTQVSNFKRILRKYTLQNGEYTLQLEM